MGKELPNALPKDLEFSDYYKEDPYLHYNLGKYETEDQNDYKFLNEILEKVIENLKKIDFAPNIMPHEVPIDYASKDKKIWDEGTDPKIIDSFIYKDKGVVHLKDLMDEERKED